MSQHLDTLISELRRELGEVLNAVQLDTKALKDTVGAVKVQVHHQNTIIKEKVEVHHKESVVKEMTTKVLRELIRDDASRS